MNEQNNTIIAQYLNRVSCCIFEMENRHKSYIDDECIFAYRGESKEFGQTKLMPSIFREKGDVVKEKYLFELLFDYNFLNPSTASKIEQAIESQHFLAISRMLDISFNILPALYFACQADDNENGYLYVFCFPEYYSPHSQYIEEFYEQVLKGEENTTYSGNFKVISHSFSNERIKAQVGGFIFFPGLEYKPISEIYYERIPILKEDKKKILKELEIYFNIREATLFPEKDKVAKNIRQRFREKQYRDVKISWEEEVEVFLNHIEYELAMLARSVTKKRYDVSRVLRKEQSDLMYYVSHSDLEKEKKEKLQRDIKDKFYFLERKYGRRNNENGAVG